MKKDQAPKDEKKRLKKKKSLPPDTVLPGVAKKQILVEEYEEKKKEEKVVPDILERAPDAPRDLFPEILQETTNEPVPKEETMPVLEESSQVLAPPEELKVELERPRKRLGKKRRKISQKLAEEEKEIRLKKEKEKHNGKDKLLSFALKYTRLPARFLASRVPELREDLLRSNLNISPEGIVAISLLFAYLSVPLMIFGIFEMINLGLYIGIIFMPVIAVMALVIGLNIPKISAASRAQALDNELPYLVGYITVLAGGGISPMVTMKRVSKADKIFPAAAKEARRIMLDIEVFGLDAISAFERAARYSANRMYADFIGGYVAVLKTGGDSVSYLETKLKEMFSYRETKLKASANFIETMAEAYIITTVVMGVSLMILFATQNLMSANVTSIDPTMIIMFSGLFVPVISMVFIVVIGSSQVKEPFSYDKPFYVFLACAPVGALIYFLPLGLSPYMQLGVALLCVSTPPMIIQMSYTRQKKAVEAKLSNFLRDISEVRKTGLAPEKTIEQLADRNYGGLSKHVKKIATQLSWGTPIRSVLENFSKEVKSWVTRAMAFLLLEVVDVGGGSPRMFISLADFTEKNNQLEKEKRSMTRPYIIIPYIGAILVVATTAMMVYYVSAPSLTSAIPSGPGTPSYLPSASIVKQATTILLLGSFFQAWIMGLVAGKMGEGSAADGFKHSTFLIIISMVTVLVAQLFIGLP